MGFQKIKRPLLAARGMTIQGNDVEVSTGQTNYNASTRNAAGMGFRVEAVQSLTSTATNSGVLTAGGYTFINTTATTTAKTWKLPVPGRKGIVKNVVVYNQTSKAAKVITATTPAVFFGTTYATINFATGTNKLRSVTIVGQSSATWAVVGKTTGVTISA